MHVCNILAVPRRRRTIFEFFSRVAAVLGEDAFFGILDSGCVPTVLMGVFESEVRL